MHVAWQSYFNGLLIAAGLIMASLLASHPLWLAVARWGGAAFLIYYGGLALMRALRPQGLEQDTSRRPRSLRAVLLAALAVTLLNPHVYLDTVLLIGSVGAREAVPGAYVLGAASASLLWFLSLALGAAWLAPKLARPLTWRLIDLAVAATLLGIAARLLLGE